MVTSPLLQAAGIPGILHNLLADFNVLFYINHTELLFSQKVRAPLDGLRLLRKSLSLSLFVCLVCL